MASRRSFLHKTSAALLFTGLHPTSVGNTAPFKMKYAPHFGMFEHSAGKDLIDQIKFMSDQGFRALEDNNLKNRDIQTQEAIGRELQRLNMEMGVFVASNAKNPSLTTGEPEHIEAFVNDLKESVDVAKRVNATWMTVVPGFTDHKKNHDFQTANMVEALKRGAEVFEPHGLVMVLEPLNPRNHPNRFLKRVPHAYAICKAVGSPAVKILDDLYHQQITEGNLIPNMDMAWDEIGYFQIGDNPNRKEPTTGEINYKNIFRHIHNKGFTGILGMEHGNAMPGKEGEMALIKAYRTVDDF
ncbi:MAG: hydroxypyruvate isomerase family protein [Rhodothermales bacterium]